MRAAIEETNRRREVQRAYNEAHGITPQTIRKAIGSPLIELAEADYVEVPLVAEPPGTYLALADIPGRIAALRKEMREAAAALEFERAAELRDEIQQLQARELELRGAAD
jgi:excinuclease ABC subunit B